jgi:nucleotide-binding universal stress UspA family protein
MAIAWAEQKPQKILLATDLTPAGDRAFDRAVQLASDWGAQLVVCHVIEASSLRPWGVEQRVRNAELEIERLVKGAPLAQEPSRHIVIGDPAERTIEHAEAIGCDFIVTGPAHGKIVGDKLLGSTAARIVRLARKPVLAVRRRVQGPYATVAVAVDFSEPSQQAYRCARSLFGKSQFMLVHAYAVAPDYSGGNADRPLDEVEAEEKARVLRMAEQDMTDLIGNGRKEASIETLLEQGAPHAVLNAYVDKGWPDLVVAGMRGRSGAQQPLIGSVTDDLLKSLPCDVLAVPADR